MDIPVRQRPCDEAGPLRVEASDAALDRLLGHVRAERAAHEAAQRMSPDTVAMMKAAGVYRALVAQRFGGDEMRPADFLRLIERIATADGSAGWVASFGFAAVYLAALPIATLETIYADGPDIAVSVAIYPPQPAARVDGGLLVSGRWPWASGCAGADLLGVGIKVDDGGAEAGLPRIAVMPAARATIVDNWEVNGLKGTGSHDIVARDVLVREAWTFVRGGPASLDTPLYRYPSLALAAQAMAVSALGCARDALDTLTGIAAARASITGAPALADRAYLQIDLARAEAALRSARSWFYEVIEAAFDTVAAGDPLGEQAQVLLRLAATNAARVGADTARAAYTAAGTTGIFTDHPIARAMQDAMIIPQHAFLAEGTWQSAGRALLGLPSAPGYP